MAEMGLVKVGHVFEDSAEIEALHQEVSDLKRELSEARREAASAKRQAERATSNLRRQLSPLYRAFQDVFGELEDLGGSDGAPSSAAWDEWKNRLGPSCAKVIDTLLLGGEMSVKAIQIAAKMGQQTVYQATSKMGQAGILVRNGSKFSLKKL